MIDLLRPILTELPRCSRRSHRGALRVGLLVLVLALSRLGPPAAADPVPSLAAQLGGKTLSAVVYVPRTAGAPGGGSLQRIVLQAYLAVDGRTVVRQWVPERNSYSTPQRTTWRLNDKTLCIDLPSAPLCAEVHIWGPRIAGIGQQPYAMLDGDLQPGNAITGRR